MSARMKHAEFLQKGTKISLQWCSFHACHGRPQPTHHSTNHSTQSNPSDLSSAFLLCFKAKFEHKKSGAAALHIGLRSYHRTTGTTIPNDCLHGTLFHHGSLNLTNSGNSQIQKSTKFSKHQLFTAWLVYDH